MSLAKVTQQKVGDLALSIYDYAVAGDVLPMHVHVVHEEHVIFVRLGRVKLRIQNPKDNSIEEVILESGSMVDTFSDWPHEIVGLVDNSRTIHIQKWMMGNVTNSKG